MGMDMWCVFQKFDEQRWISVDSTYDAPRHYLLHDILGGDADCFLDRVSPIALCRGLPHDLEPDPPKKQRYGGGYSRMEYFDGHYLGDRNQTWYTAEELLKWRQEITGDFLVKRYCYVPIEEYRQRGRPVQPASCLRLPPLVKRGDRVYSDSSAREENLKYSPDANYVEIEYIGSAFKSTDYFFDEVKRLKELHGRVRFICGFSS